MPDDRHYTNADTNKQKYGLYKIRNDVLSCDSIHGRGRKVRLETSCLEHVPEAVMAATAALAPSFSPVAFVPNRSPLASAIRPLTEMPPTMPLALKLTRVVEVPA